ncbi:MAG: hypothetical protein QW568_04970 [Candidatus Anstonellaceae archaeon]
MEESIKTQFDDLLASLKFAGGRPISVHSLSSSCGMPEKAVLDWLHVLEKNGQVHLENRISGIFASWTGEITLEPKAKSAEMPLRTLPSASTAPSYSPDSAIERAHEIEIEAKKSKGQKISEPQENQAPLSVPEIPAAAPAPLTLKKEHKVLLQEVDADLATIGKQIEQVESMIAKLKEAKKQKAAEKKKEQETASVSKKPVEIPAPAEEEKSSKLLEEVEKEVLSHEVEEESGELGIEEADVFEPEKKPLEQKQPFDLEIKPLGKEPEEDVVRIPTLSYIRAKEAARKKSKVAKIKRPEPVQVASVSLQFSDKLARQIKRIIRQTQEIERLRMEKEKLLTEHYLPMQRRLESEIETISDRVLRMEKNIIGLHQRASDLPGKVTEVEKLQISSLKAHGQMRRAYDEASALIEESNRLLSDEREKMEMIAEQSRQEIALHKAKTIELEGVLSHISQMEEEASNKVIAARAALAEQAERLASAESYAKELSSLKDEIANNVNELKRDISSTKGILTTLEKQMEQMRQVELYTESIRQDYDKKINELGDYIRHGNEEFDTLRESVEANFVRRYLRELRQLTDSYTFEFNQVRQSEKDIETRIEEEKKNLEQLLEEGRKISYLYELQAKEPAGAEKFEQRGETFRSVQELSSKRSQIEQLIAQVVGKRSDYQPKKEGANVTVSAPKVSKSQKPKASKAKAKGKKGKK